MIINIIKKYPFAYRLLKYLYFFSFRLITPTSNKIKILDKYKLQCILPDTKISFWGYFDRIPVNNNGEILVHTVENQICFIKILNSTFEEINSITTSAWNWQQGSLCTWINDKLFIYNDIENGKVVTRIFDLGKNKIVLNHPGTFQALTKNGDIIAFLNNDKFRKYRPDYSFAGDEGLLMDDELCSFYKLQISKTNKPSLKKKSTFKRIYKDNETISGEKINHVLFSPNGMNAICLRRSWQNKVKMHSLELLMLDGSTKILMRGQIVSHYCWVNDEEILFWGVVNGYKGYHLININSLKITINVLGLSSIGDGHPSKLLDGYLTDSYPNRSGFANLYFLKDDTQHADIIGKFFQPLYYDETKRIDLHPKYSSYFDAILFDSGHSGNRQAYLCKVRD